MPLLKGSCQSWMKQRMAGSLMSIKRTKLAKLVTPNSGATKIIIIACLPLCKPPTTKIFCGMGYGIWMISIVETIWEFVAQAAKLAWKI
ncbi:hypothetical protein SAY87_027016 [Trapa incisa]|uniref:Uncharacterized protein n=1 Tax=Trapa incisa TaxID=236973 RepID=A0AAN7GYL3_9MYRT|nr:hypothetical protein SAY87_027016 [Trapa incisa]